MAYDTTEAVAKFLSGFQMKITNRERGTVVPDYYVEYLLTLSKGGKDYSLSGEAKEAALSRFALPENRKAALDVIRKLNESRDSNENAL